MMEGLFCLLKRLWEIRAQLKAENSTLRKRNKKLLMSCAGDMSVEEKADLDFVGRCGIYGCNEYSVGHTFVNWHHVPGTIQGKVLLCEKHWCIVMQDV